MISQDYFSQVAAVVCATVINSPTTFSWFGQPSSRLASRVARALTGDNARKYILYSLQNQLYTDFYCAGGALPTAGRLPVPTTPGMETPFISKLSEANTGRGCWQSGWGVLAVEGSPLEESFLIVQKDGLVLRATPQDCQLPSNRSVSQGTKISLRFPKELYAITPGFYMALGDNDLTEVSTHGLVRLYWHVGADSAADLVNLVTGDLNRAGIPFRLKVLNDPDSFARCDAAVLYLDKSCYDTVRPIVETIYSNVAAHLKPGIPALTKPLAPGLGLAEDPATGESFGQHRCRLLAEGLVRAYEQGASSPAAKLEASLSRFAEDEVDLRRPYLNPNSVDHYAFESNAQVQPRRSVAWPVVQKASTIEGTTFLDVALQIGDRITLEAICHEDMCNWIGAVVQKDSGRRDVVYRALGPDLYNGTAGIALFLAELYAATGGRHIRRASLGAIRQALAFSSELSSPLAFYTGQLGIAYAAIRVGITLNQDDLVESGMQLCDSCVQDCTRPRAYDLLSGTAGAIVGLLAVDDLLGCQSFAERAVQLGEDLLLFAKRSREGYSWASPGLKTAHNLTGLSHGASGFGYAFSELYKVTQKLEHRIAAERAFDYERHWFDAREKNWPDFRKARAPGRSKRNALSPWQFAGFWCHGAPGIALARLRAHELLNDESYRVEALIGLDTTARRIEADLLNGANNFSLCHGLAGNAEILLDGSRLLGSDADVQSHLAYEVAQVGMQRYTGKAATWPCGLPGVDTPGLMLGRAGIGFFYMRLQQPSISSILLPGRTGAVLQQSLC